MPIQHVSSQNGASDYPEALSHYNDQAPLWRVLLYPHRSLSRNGFVIFMGVTSVMIAVPVLPLVGTKALWGVLPFLVGTIVLLWLFLKRNYRDGHIVEELSLWSDHICLIRLNPRGPLGQRRQEWSANPFWVSVSTHDTPVKNYLTLTGGKREVELGAFLSPDERLTLKAALETQLKNLSQPET